MLRPDLKPAPLTTLSRAASLPYPLQHTAAYSQTSDCLDTAARPMCVYVHSPTLGMGGTTPPARHLPRSALCPVRQRSFTVKAPYRNVVGDVEGEETALKLGWVVLVASSCASLPACHPPERARGGTGTGRGRKPQKRNRKRAHRHEMRLTSSRLGSRRRLDRRCRC